MKRHLAAARLSIIALALVPILASAIGESPVADAAMNADRQLVLALIKRGADVNVAQGDRMTALHWAVMNDDLELAQGLIRAGSHVNAATRLDAYTPILIAARDSNAAILEALPESRRRHESTDHKRRVSSHAGRRFPEVRMQRRSCWISADINARAGSRGNRSHVPRPRPIARP